MESTAQYWRPVWEALEQHWRPRCRMRDGAPRLASQGRSISRKRNRIVGPGTLVATRRPDPLRQEALDPLHLPRLA